VGQGQAFHAGGLCGHNAEGCVLDGEAFAGLKQRFMQLGKSLETAECFEIYLGVRLRALAVICRRQHREFSSQAKLLKKMFDFRVQAAAGDGQGKALGGVEDKLRRPGNGWQAVLDDLLVGAHLPGQEFIAPGGAEGASVATPEVLDDAAVIESEIMPIIFFFGEDPALSIRHLLEKFHDEGFAVNEDAVKIKNDSAQQECWSPVKFGFPNADSTSGPHDTLEQGKAARQRSRLS
jgi:hypothetical protein